MYDSLLLSSNIFKKFNEKIFFFDKNNCLSFLYDCDQKFKNFNDEKNINLNEKTIFFSFFEKIYNRNDFLSVIFFNDSIYNREELKKFFLEKILNSFKKNKKNKLKFLISSSDLENILVEFGIKNKKISLNFFSTNSVLCSFLKSFLPDLKKRLKKNKIIFDEIEVLKKDFFNKFKKNDIKNKNLKYLQNNFYKSFENKYFYKKKINSFNLIKQYKFSNILLNKD